MKKSEDNQREIYSTCIVETILTLNNSHVIKLWLKFSQRKSRSPSSLKITLSSLMHTLRNSLYISKKEVTLILITLISLYQSE